VTAALGQASHGLSLLEGAEVLPLDVLDQRHLDDLGVIDFADDDRDLPKPDPNGRLVTALAGDDLVAPTSLANHERLDDALLVDRRHQLGQVAHDLPRL